MIIFNWPDRCPNETCHSPNIFAINVVAEDVPNEDARLKLKEPGAQVFLCNDCSSVWVEVLVRTKEISCFIASEQNNWDRPLAILSGSVENVKNLFGLDKNTSISIRRLEHLFEDGENRVLFVRDDPKKAQTVWLRGQIIAERDKRTRS